MEKKEKALALFGSGFNCAQAVVGVFCEAYGAEFQQIMKLATGLGGGFQAGEICGAASGAALVIGLRYGQGDAADQQAKQECRRKTGEFMELFRARNGGLQCQALLGVNTSTEAGRAYQQAHHAQMRAKCDGYVRAAVELLEELGY